MTYQDSIDISKDGLHQGLSFEQYAAIGAYNHSLLKVAIQRSWLHFKWAINNPERKVTAALEFGEAFHCAVLEPQRFEREYLVAPKLDKRFRANKDVLQKYAEQNPGRTILDTEDFKALQGMAFSVFSEVDAVKLLKGTTKELSVVASRGDLRLKARIDALNLDFRYVLDLKTTEDASEGGFRRSILKYNYHTQAAFYLEVLSLLGLDFSDFVFICVEKTPPYAVGIYRLADSDISEGRTLLGRYLGELSECVRTDTYPGYGGRIRDIAIRGERISLTTKEQQYAITT